MATPRELFDAFRNCALRSDGDGFAALCTEDVVMEFPFLRVRFCGRADVRDRTVLAWRDARRRIVEFQFIRITEASESLVAEYELVGYADHSPFRAGVVLLLETRGGMIAGLREYVDPSAGVASPV
jgi:ketosteroid isomerase-like protein